MLAFKTKLIVVLIIFTLKRNLTIRASLAPRPLLFLPKGPKGPSVHPVRYYFYSRARRALPCTPSVTILPKGPKGPSVS